MRHNAGHSIRYEVLFVSVLAMVWSEIEEKLETTMHTQPFMCDIAYCLSAKNLEIYYYYIATYIIHKRELNNGLKSVMFYGAF